MTETAAGVVDRRWSVAGQMLTALWLGRRQAPEDSPLTLQGVLSRDDYRDPMTAKVAEGELAPDRFSTRHTAAWAGSSTGRHWRR